MLCMKSNWWIQTAKININLTSKINGRYVMIIKMLKTLKIA